jgi:phage tail-like protein
MPSPQFVVNAYRYDPYLKFKFAVFWEGRYVAGMSQISALTRNTQPIDYREGGDPSVMRKQPGMTSFEPITLSRGVTHDKEFEQWANRVWNIGGAGGAEISLENFRRDIIIELRNEAGQKVMAYNVYRCWVSQFTALPDLDASESAVAIQSIQLQHEGWERDLSVVEPVQPSFTIPD